MIYLVYLSEQRSSLKYAVSVRSCASVESRISSTSSAPTKREHDIVCSAANILQTKHFEVLYTEWQWYELALNTNVWNPTGTKAKPWHVVLCETRVSLNNGQSSTLITSYTDRCSTFLKAYFMGFHRNHAFLELKWLFQKTVMNKLRWKLIWPHREAEPV